MKNPAVRTLVIVAIIAAVIAIVLLAISVSGLFSSYDFETDQVTSSVPLWVAAIPAAIAVLAGIGAVVVWGQQQGSSSGE